MQERLTKKQEAILKEIKSFIRVHGYPPTIRELGDTFNVASSSMFDHLKAIERKGYLKRSESKSRSMELSSFISGKRTIREIVEVPLVGRISAGSPVLAVENIEGSIALDKEWLRAGEHFLLKVEGNSMIDKQIREGDYVIVQPQSSVLNGDIVVALIDDEATVKTFRRKKDHILLMPANPNYTPIKTSSDITIIGKVVGLVRKY